MLPDWVLQIPPCIPLDKGEGNIKMMAKPEVAAAALKSLEGKKRTETRHFLRTVF